MFLIFDGWSDFLPYYCCYDTYVRPKASEVLLHPLFWKSKKRVSFLRDASDRLQSEDRTNSIVLASLEKERFVAFGGRWDAVIGPVFINGMCYGRKTYNYKKVQDLLRIMRNTINHYRELPPNIQVGFSQRITYIN
ncbi:putative non-specific serine/threonine protein kinase [Helianthus anomalus]